jgi:hypothetical protein
MKLEKSLVGACGVFYVSAELSRRGWIAMPTIRNTSGVDIIATKDNKSVSIQVKTSSYGRTKYTLTESNEKLISDRLFYVFVTLREKEAYPTFYVVPSKLVAEYIKRTHEYWTKLPPRMRKAIYEGATKDEIVNRRRESKIRGFPNWVGETLPEYRDFSIDKYRDKWDSLENEPIEKPMRLDHP